MAETEQPKTPEGHESAIQQPVSMEIIPNVFDQDKNPNINSAIPEHITTDSEGYTTVWRKNICTLYNPEGKVKASIPTEYLNAREKNNNKDTPVVIGDPEKPQENYLLAPSSLKKFPGIKENDQGVFDPNRINPVGHPLSSPSIWVFLRDNGLFSDPNPNQRYREAYPYSYLRYSVTTVNRDWEGLIQKGKIQFADEEKTAKFSKSVKPSSLEMASPAIKTSIGAASWICHFPQKKSLFQSGETKKLALFDWSDDIASNWSITEFDLPKETMSVSVTAAGIDPADNFLLVAAGKTLYVLNHHEKPMSIAFKLESPDAEFYGQISLREDGSILAGDEKGRLTSIISNLHTFVPRGKRLEQERTLQRLRAKERERHFKEHVQKPAEVPPEIQEFSKKISDQFAGDIAKAISLDDIEALKTEIRGLKADYEKELKDAKTVDAIFKPVLNALALKETEILSVGVDREMTAIRGLMQRIQGMSLADLAEARMRIDRVKATVMGSSLDPEIKTEIAQISDVFSERASEVLGKDEEKLLTQLEALFSAAKQKLTAIARLSEFEVWQSTDYPAFLDALAGQMRIVPASHQKVLEKLREMEKSMRDLKKRYGDQFKQQYEEVRKQAANRTDVVIGLAADRIAEFLETFGSEVQKKSFGMPEEARQWVERSPLYASAMAVLEDLAAQDPEKAEEFKQKLKVEIAQLSYEVKRLKDATVDETTGRQMAVFGGTAFPVWEHRLEERQNVKIELIYKVDDSSKGPGIKPEDYMCELFYKVTGENGQVHEIPMYDEDTLKYGRYDERFYDEGAYFPSHLTLGHARKMLSAIKAKESKRASEVTRKYDEFQAKIKALNEKIRTLDLDQLKKERAELTKEYVTFLHESGLYGWFALRAFKNRYHNGEDIETAAGQGRIPDWAPYWVVDDATDKALEQFAQMAKMSLNLREGIISLEGHAGTGKDVLVQMFANKTKRPLYSFDCTKWTTEFDLSQDVSLAAEEGASFTVKDDSIIVKALEAPGAILYFNEFNAMPEQAQIFLHSLFDAKRQITLKTSSGRIVKADPTVIICSSMNPGYPGTTHPQFATRSRMVPIKLAFPEFKKPDGTFASAEALRIARSVKSLQDLTYDPDMEENAFVKLWDNCINRGASNGDLTPERKFDLEVIFALITFATQLREGFINKIAKRGGRKTFTISQPFTLREMRRCAFMLSSMDPAKKQNPDNAEAVAKDLIRQFYSQYIFEEKEAEELETNLAQWTVQKPMRTGQAAGPTGP